MKWQLAVSIMIWTVAGLILLGLVLLVSVSWFAPWQVLYAIFAEVSWLLIGYNVGWYGGLVGFKYLRPMIKGNEADGLGFRAAGQGMMIQFAALGCALISACVAAFHLGSPMSTCLSVCGTVNAALLLAVIGLAAFPRSG